MTYCDSGRGYTVHFFCPYITVIDIDVNVDIQHACSFFAIAGEQKFVYLPQVALKCLKIGQVRVQNSSPSNALICSLSEPLLVSPALKAYAFLCRHRG